MASRVAKRLKTQDLRKLANIGIISNFIELQPNAQSHSQQFFFNTSKETPEKQKLTFSRSALFLMKTRVCFKYFMNYCSFSLIQTYLQFHDKIKKIRSNKCAIKKQGGFLIIYESLFKELTLIHQCCYKCTVLVEKVTIHLGNSFFLYNKKNYF